MALKPVADRVIVKYLRQSKNRIRHVLPDSSREKTQQAEVIAVGGGYRS